MLEFVCCALLLKCSECFRLVGFNFGCWQFVWAAWMFTFGVGLCVSRGVVFDVVLGADLWGFVVCMRVGLGAATVVVFV